MEDTDKVTLGIGHMGQPLARVEGANGSGPGFWPNVHPGLDQHSPHLWRRQTVGKGAGSPGSGTGKTERKQVTASSPAPLSHPRRNQTDEKGVSKCQRLGSVPRVGGCHMQRPSSPLARPQGPVVTATQDSA